MALVTRASATVGAKRLGKTIPGNMVVGVYRPDFAIRLLKASVAAGIEAPIRFYITEDPKNGKTTLSYRTRSSVFSPYKNSDLDAMAKELDVIFAKIAADATKQKLAAHPAPQDGVNVVRALHRRQMTAVVDQDEIGTRHQTGNLLAQLRRSQNVFAAANHQRRARDSR